MLRFIGRLCRAAALLTILTGALCAASSDHWVVYDGFEGPGNGRHVVLISGDEEYRSEEALPQLGKILAKHHGFRCTILFAIDPDEGTIDPEQPDNIPGMHLLESADLVVISTRFRELPDDQMKHFVDYVESGRPIIGMRTATHAFRYSDESNSKYKHYSFNSKEWDGGFGRQVLGETWISHHGHHAVQSTRGVIAEGAKNHPIVRGCDDIWGPTDVYTVRLPLPGDAEPLVLGQVLTGMEPDDPPVRGKYIRELSNGRTLEKTPNDPMMPVAWTKTYTGASGKTARVFTTTMGAAVDLESEGVRRMLVNGAYWCLGLEERMSPEARVDLVGDYQPSMFGFGKFKSGMRPVDFAMRP